MDKPWNQKNLHICCLSYPPKKTRIPNQFQAATSSQIPQGLPGWKYLRFHLGVLWYVGPNKEHRQMWELTCPKEELSKDRCQNWPSREQGHRCQSWPEEVARTSMTEIEQACIGAVAQSNSCTRWEAGPGLRPRHTEEHRDTVCVQSASTTACADSRGSPNAPNV